MSSPSPNRKRKLHSTRLEESISPPPLRRRRLDSLSTPTQASNTSIAQLQQKPTWQDGFEIISWNINGIKHLLPPLASTQKQISSFFKKPDRLKREVSPQGQNSTFVQSDVRKTEDREFTPLRTFLRRHEYPPVLCLQEVKISPSDTLSRDRLQKAANPDPNNRKGEDEARYKAFWSLPRDKFNARGLGGKQKVYGVCTLIRTDLLDVDAATCGVTEKSRGRIRHEATKDVEWDTEGRILVSTFIYIPSPSAPPQLPDDIQTPNKKQPTPIPEHLIVINSYWPNGTTYDWKDPLTGSTLGTRHDAKRHFHTQTLSLASSYQTQNHHVVLIGDMNIALTILDGYPNLRLGDEHVKNRADFTRKFLDAEEKDGFRGVDSFRFVNGTERKYSYHGERAEEWGRSCDRVDLGIVSRSLVAESANSTRENETEYQTERKGMRLVGAEIYESVKERGGSDHVPISVVLALC